MAKYWKLIALLGRTKSNGDTNSAISNEDDHIQLWTFFGTRGKVYRSPVSNSSENDRKVY